jgi:hypothetical protein
MKTSKIYHGGGIKTSGGFSGASIHAEQDLVWAATITPSLTVQDFFTLELNSVTPTLIENPTGAYNGQRFCLCLRQPAAGSATVTWGAKYRFSTDIPIPVLTTTALKADYLAFIYNHQADKFDLIGFIKGF